MLTPMPYICDVPAYRLTRPGFQRGVTATISSLGQVLNSNHHLGAVLDLRGIAKLRPSEVLALIETVLAHGGQLLSAVLAQPAVFDQLKDSGIQRFLRLVHSAEDLIMDPIPQLLDQTQAIVLFNRRVPFLGPLADLDAENLCDATGRAPWAATLDLVLDSGIGAIVLVLTANQAKLAQGLRQYCQGKRPVSILLDDGDPISVTQRVWNRGLGWAGGAFVIDGWCQFAPSTLAAVRAFPQMAAGQLTHITAQSCDPAAHGLSYVTHATIERFGTWQGSWPRTLRLAENMGVLASPPQMGAVLDVGTLLGRAQLIQDQRGFYASPAGAKAIDRRAQVDAQSVVCAGASVAKGARIDGSIILPGAHVQSGAWISNKIVAPNWAVDLAYADQLPLNLAPEDRVSVLQERKLPRLIKKTA